MKKLTIDQQILKCAVFINIMQKITGNVGMQVFTIQERAILKDILSPYVGKVRNDLITQIKEEYRDKY